MSARNAIKPRTEGRHIGFGKVILFGEHLVVYGAPAIVAGISQYTDCKLELTPGKPGWEVVDKRPAVPGYIKEKAAEQRVAHELVLKHLKIDTSKDGLKIHLGGPLVPSSGIGASASDVVSLSRALGEMYGIKMTEDEINHSAWVGESGYHGTPSGVDNTAATFGGLLTYQRTSKGPKFTKIAFGTELFLIVVGTGITASTTKVVGEVKQLKESKPAWWKDIMSRYEVIIKKAAAAIASGDLDTLGAALNENHTICQELTISCKELDSIVDASRQLGAIGAKMSGTGRGGIAVALARTKADQDRIAKGLKEQCPAAKFIWKYSVEPPKVAKL